MGGFLRHSVAGVIVYCALSSSQAQGENQEYQFSYFDRTSEERVSLSTNEPPGVVGGLSFLSGFASSASALFGSDSVSLQLIGELAPLVRSDFGVEGSFMGSAHAAVGYVNTSGLALPAGEDPVGVVRGNYTITASGSGHRIEASIRLSTSADPSGQQIFGLSESSTAGEPTGTFSFPIQSGEQAFFVISHDIDFLRNGGDFGDEFFEPGVLTTASLRLDLNYTVAFGEFIWDGKEGLSFSNPDNWEIGLTPEAQDTVKLTATQAKQIEFANSSLTQNRRLIVEGDSDTTVDLNGGVWRIDPDTATPAADGQFRMAGATLTVKDGTLEVFGNALLLNDGATPGLLQLFEGGKLALRGDDFITGRGVGNQPVFLAVDGLGSLLEARAIVLGEESGIFSGLVTSGGRVVANQALAVGSNAAAEIRFEGVANPEEPLNSASRLTVADGGTLDVGGNAAGSVFLASGAIGMLTNATINLGSDSSDGRLSVSNSSQLIGGRFTVNENGLLQVSDSQASIQKLEVEGGVVEVKAGGQILMDETLALFGGAFLTIEGQSLVSSPTLFTASSRIHITGNSMLSVPGELGTTLFPMDGTASSRMLGGTLLIEQGSVISTPVLNLQGGTVLGRGTIRGIVVNNGASILPGQSPGILTIEGDYLQSGGRIVLEIGGMNAGTQYDRLVITGNFDITGGEIEFSFINGFAPLAGNTFSFFDVGGTFTGTPTFRVSGLEDGWQFETAFDLDSGNFRLTSLNDAVAVPEPSAVLLLILSGIGLGLVRRNSVTRNQP